MVVSTGSSRNSMSVSTSMNPLRASMPPMTAVQKSLWQRLLFRSSPRYAQQCSVVRAQNWVAIQV